MSENKVRRIGFKILKIFGWIVLSVVGTLVIVALSIQIPWVQNKIKQKAITFLENKIGTRVELEHFSLSFPKKIIIRGFYVEDQEKDTLLYAGRLGIDTDLWALTDNVIELKKIELKNFSSRIKRAEKDSTFNFDYIIKAFVTDTVQQDTTASTPWDFSVGDVELQNLRFYLEDDLSGNYVNLRLAELNINTEKFDLRKSEIGFDDINLSGVKAEVVQTKIPEALPDSVEIVPEDSSAVGMNIDFNSIVLKDIQASYLHKGTGQIVNITMPKGLIEADSIDIKRQVIDLSKISLSNTYISYDQMLVKKNEKPAVSGPAPADEGEEPWKFSLETFDLAGFTIQYNDFNSPLQKDQMDFNHLWISDLDTKIRNIKVTPGVTSADISQIAFREKSGFRIAAMRSSIVLLEDSLALDKFYIRTENSFFRMDAKARFKSLEGLSENFDDALFSLNVKPSAVSVRDLLYFSPNVLDSLPVVMEPSSTVRMEAMVLGTLKDLTVERLQIHAFENTSLFVSGRLHELLQPDLMSYNVTIDRFSTTRKDVKSILADTLIPPSIEIPGWISLKGNYKGTIKAPDTKTQFTSEFGDLNLNAKLNLNKGIKENYKGEVVIKDFNLGKLLKQPQQMGRLDMVATVNGAGLTLKELDALLKVRVNRLQYNGYTYRNFRLDGSMKKYFFSGKASMIDENINFVLTGDLDYNKDEPHYGLTLDLRNIDLKNLKLTPNPIRVKGQLVVDMTTPDFQKLNGDLGIRKFAVFNGDKLYAVDSLLFASIDQEGTSEISIRSDIVSGDFKGTINIFSLPDLLNRHFNRYFALRDTSYNKPLEDQEFKFELVLKNTDLITEILVPDLDPFVPGKISGDFSSAEHKLNLNFSVAKIRYSGVALDSISLKVISDPASLDFTLGLHEILFDTLNIKTIRFAGNVMNDSIRTNLMILDSLDMEKYFLGGVFYSLEDAFRFSFLKNHIILNYEEWDTPRYNSLRFTDRGLDPNNFLIRNGEERILLLKKNNRDSTLSVNFSQVDLKNLTSLVEGTTPLGGIIDGEFTLSSAAKGQFETEMGISHLAVLEQEWGNLAFRMTKGADTPMNFKLNLQGTDAELKADGFLGAGEDPDISIKASVPRLNLAITEPLTMGQLKDLKGILTGELSVEGKSKDPRISGRVNLSNTSFLSTFTNTTFSIENESIYLREKDFVFDNFEILDSKKNKAAIEGLVSSNPDGGFDLRLNLSAKDFQLINTTAEDNDLFYGKAWLNVKATITGTSLQPIIRMDVSLSNESEITYVVPQSDKGVMEQKGIVVFIDKDAVNDPFMAGIDPKDTIQTGYAGMDLTANIEFSDKEKFNVIIDPVSGDRLSVRGNSMLALHMDPTGDMQLSGRYEITEGTYDLSFAKFVKRNFVIDKGSTITWTGDPLNGQMDIRAIYTVETSPADLVANQVSDEELNQYKKQAEFQVYLILKGELLFPDISFRLDMPEEDRNEYGGNIYAKLQDINQEESDLNKQVFALLILKRFISDNPFESEAGGDLASSARKSVSKILSDQLNRLSSNVKGVELSVDVKSYEDYTEGSGQAQTELQLGVSKTMLNDRLLVKVSGTVDVEGNANQQNSFTDYIGDIALEYKLTEDGRLRVTGFRNSNYDLIDGDVIETGTGLIYIKDYDSFRELFKPNANKK